jgi:urease subunit gamma
MPYWKFSKSDGILFAPFKPNSFPNLIFLIMHLTPKEIDKLLLLSLGAIAERRKERGLKLNHPEAVAYITSAALEAAREGKTVEQVMTLAAGVLKRDDVMEGVADMIDLLQVEAVFTDGSRLVSIHKPIK